MSESRAWLYGYVTALFDNGIIDYREGVRLEKIGFEELEKFAREKYGY